MLGAIAGDIVGSVFEFNNNKTTDFSLFSPDSRFTDDTVLTVAVADAILNKKSYLEKIRQYGLKYPDEGYGHRFRRWLFSKSRKPYNSFGNGSAMRVSPVGFAFNTVGEVLEEARKSAEITHSHPEGIRGAQAVALSIFLARKGEGRESIRGHIEKIFAYDLGRKLDDIRRDYRFDESCQGTVPEAITAFLESQSYEDAVRKAVSLGGDSDTIACMAGGIAQAFYRNIPVFIINKVRDILKPELMKVADEFCREFHVEM